MQTPSRIFDRLPALGGRLLLLTFIAAVQLAGSAYAESITLAWDANTEPNVAGYHLYRSGQSGVFGSTPLNGGTLITGTTYTDSSVQPGNTYYYVATAVSTTGEKSDRSAQVQAVIPPLVTNAAPVVNLASSQTITLPQTATLSASASDDGLPNGGLSYQWSKVSGAGVSFSSPNLATTQATFDSAGTYTLRVTVSDGQLSSSADVTVYVNAEPEQNKAPVISAIPTQTITLPQTATFSASASDDGLPNGGLSYQWSKVSGAGVSFSNANLATTQATFASAGTYTLRVTASDGQLSSSADVTVYVNAEPTSDTGTSDGTEVKGNKGKNGKNGGGNGGGKADDTPEAPTTVEAEVTTDEPPGPPANLRRSKK
jgi:fibronectin type 3 domain-containing protein